MNLSGSQPKNPILDTHIHLLKNVKGVIQCGMGEGADEVGVWNSHGIKNQIYIEALPSNFSGGLLPQVERCKSDDKNIQCFQVAVSDVDGEADFYVSNQPDSSSLLPFSGSRLPQHYKLSTVSMIKIKTVKLDTLVKQENIDLSKYNLLFLDVQNAEHLVLAGAKDLLSFMDYVCMEVGETVGAYSNSLLYGDYIPLMDGLGFAEIAKYEHRDPPDGPIVAYDVLYKKRKT